MTTRDFATNIRKINAFSSKESGRYNKYILLTDLQTKTNGNTLSSHTTISPTYKSEKKKIINMQVFTPRFKNNDKLLSKHSQLDNRSIPKNFNMSSEFNLNNFQKVFKSSSNIYISDLHKNSYSRSKSINEGIVKDNTLKYSRINSSVEMMSLRSKPNITLESTDADYKNIISQKNRLIDSLSTENEKLKEQVRVY
jgi:hypothetical protein